MLKTRNANGISNDYIKQINHHYQILGTMKREVIPDGDFRSNVSQGSEPEEIKLTEVEEEVTQSTGEEAEAVDENNAVQLHGSDIVENIHRLLFGKFVKTSYELDIKNKMALQSVLRN